MKSKSVKQCVEYYYDWKVLCASEVSNASSSSSSMAATHEEEAGEEYEYDEFMEYNEDDSTRPDPRSIDYKAPFHQPNVKVRSNQTAGY